MSSIFSLLPSISKQIDALLATQDIAELERVLAPFIKGTNLGIFPNEYEFFGMAMKIAQIVSQISWISANQQKANSLIGFIITGISRDFGWASAPRILQKPEYKYVYTSAYSLYTAIATCGVLDASIPASPFVGKVEPAKVALAEGTAGKSAVVAVASTSSPAKAKPSPHRGGRNQAPAPSSASTAQAQAQAKAQLEKGQSRPLHLCNRGTGAGRQARNAKASGAIPSADSQNLVSGMPPAITSNGPSVPTAISTGLYPQVLPSGEVISPSPAAVAAALPGAVAQAKTLDDAIQLGSTASAPVIPGSALDDMFDAADTPNSSDPKKGKSKHHSGK